MTRMRRVTVLGSTGSIGTQALDIVAANPERFQVAALSAGGANMQLLAQQAQRFAPDVVAIADESRADELRTALRDLGSSAEVFAGPDAAAHVASMPCDVVLNGITGAVGLMPTIAALRAGSTLALANKESLVKIGRAHV